MCNQRHLKGSSSSWSQVVGLGFFYHVSVRHMFFVGSVHFPPSELWFSAPSTFISWNSSAAEISVCSFLCSSPCPCSCERKTLESLPGRGGSFPAPLGQHYCPGAGLRIGWDKNAFEILKDAFGGKVDGESTPWVRRAVLELRILLPQL